MSCSATFRTRVRAFLRETRMAETNFGLRAVNDRRFLHDLNRGRDPRPDTMARIDRFMIEQLAVHRST